VRLEVRRAWEDLQAADQRITVSEAKALAVGTVVHSVLLPSCGGEDLVGGSRSAVQEAE
jgi:hypothetical protein